MAEKKTRNTDPKRKSILTAAAREFREKGYDGASMDRIADLAQASKRTVYNHFPSKDELFTAVVDLFTAEMSSLKHIVYEPNRSLEAQLGAFIEAELALTENPDWAGFTQILLSLFLRNSNLAGTLGSRYAGGENSLEIWLKAAAADGKLKVPDSKIAADLFSAMVGGAFTWQTMYRGTLDRKYVKQMKKEIIETFLKRFGKD